MMKTLALVMPAILPSWRFFDGIAPSPRIEFRQMNDAMDSGGTWSEFQPNPARVSIGELLWRLIWNPDRNAQLFLVSCAERLRDAPTQHSIDQIEAELRRDLPPSNFFQYRIVFLSAEREVITKDILFTSEIAPFSP